MHGHDYARKSIPSSNLHVEFADDLDFICDVDVDTKKLVEIVKQYYLNSASLSTRKRLNA